MTKYREAPSKPRVVHAVQFMGVDNGAPTFNEPAPSWLLAAMLRGRLAFISGELVYEANAVPVGAWFVIDEDEVSAAANFAGDAMRVVHGPQFLGSFLPIRRKAIRKPKAVKAAA